MREILNPFPGVRSFETYEAPIFFGRNKQIEELHSILLKSRFVAILGASGTGKSSLIKAGVIPYLLRDSERITWEIIHFKPENKPTDNLVSALLRTIGSSGTGKHEEIVKGVFEDETFIHQLIQRSPVKEKRNYFFYVDQFEEVFRLNNEYKSRHERNWMNNLIYAQKNNTNVYLTLSLRSEYLGFAINYDGLPELINLGAYLVPPMDQDDLKTIIIQPLRYFNIKVSDQLLERLLLDIDNSLEHLLILQHALMRTYEAWKQVEQSSMILGLHHYLAIGSIENAISLHGEELFNRLESEEMMRLAEHVFKALIVVGLPLENVNTSVTIKELSKITRCNTVLVIEVIDHFRHLKNTFILPNSTVEINLDTVIDLAHESVLEKWDRGRAWIQEEKNSAELYVRLSKAAELNQTGNGGLLTNPELDLVLKWQLQQKPNSAWAQRYDPDYDRAIVYLEHSKRDSEEEIWRKDKSARRKYLILRVVVLAFGVGLILLLFFLITAISLKYTAEENERIALQSEKRALVSKKDAEQKTKEAIRLEKIAEKHRNIAEKQHIIAEQERSFAVKQQKLALNQSLIALQQSDSANRAREEAVEQALHAEIARENAEKEHKRADSLRLIAIKEAERNNRLNKLAIAKTLAIQSIRYGVSDKNSELAKVLAKEAYALNSIFKGVVYEPTIFQALSHLVNRDNVLIGHTDQVRCIYVDKSENIISASDDGSVFLWDKMNKQKLVLFKIKSAIVDLIQLNDPEKYLLLTNEGHILRAKKNKKRNELVFPKNFLIKQLFTYSDTLILCSKKNELFTCAPPYLESQLTKIDLPMKVIAVAYDSSSHSVCCTLEGGRLVLLNTRKSWAIEKQLKLEYPSHTIALSGHKKTVAWADSSNTIHLWQYVKNKTTTTNIKHQSSINKILIHSQLPLVVSASYDGTIRLWDYENGQGNEPIVLTAHDSWVHNIMFYSDNKTLLSVAKDRTVRFWNIIPELLEKSIVISHPLLPEGNGKYNGQ